MGIAWIKMSHTLLARTLGIILSGFFVQLMKQTQYEKRLFLRSDSMLLAELPVRGSLHLGAPLLFLFPTLDRKEHLLWILFP